MTVSPRSVLIVGTGLLGTSIGLALVRVGWSVHLADSQSSALRLAVSLGAGVPDEPQSPPDVVVLAVPPSSVATAAGEVAAKFDRATLTDVASVKSSVQQAMQDVGLADRYIGGHPMAGRERSGAEAARADLFEARPWVLCPAEGADTSRVDDVLALIEAVGALPVTMSAADHDSAVAKVSHVPQLVASLLAAQLVDASNVELELAGQGLRDTVRIAASDPTLWADIIAANAPAVGASLRALAADLGAVVADLDRIESLNRFTDKSLKQESGIMNALEHGNLGYRRIPGKHGAPAVSYAVVPVVIPDEPGALARLFASAGEAGINIEDVAIEHSPGQPVGLVELSVAPDSAEPLAHALAAMGWSVH